MDKSELKERLKQCEKEELSIVFPAFTYTDAWEVGMLLVENAKQMEAPVAVEIEMNGTEIFHYTFPGAAKYNNLWLTKKKNMVRMKQISSLHAGYLLEYSGLDLEKDWLLDPKKFAVKGGGFPIRITGSGCIGSIACSGLPHEQDHQLIIDTLNRYLGMKIR